MVETFRGQAGAEEGGSGDGEWNLFARFSESIFRFSMKQLGDQKSQDQLMVAFRKLTSHEDRVAFLLAQEQFRSVIEMLMLEVSKSKQSFKDCELAKQAREEGNELFKHKHYQESLDKYSKVKLAFKRRGSKL